MEKKKNNKYWKINQNPKILKKSIMDRYLKRIKN